jgi:hypothetical protein
VNLVADATTGEQNRIGEVHDSLLCAYAAGIEHIRNIVIVVKPENRLGWDMPRRFAFTQRKLALIAVLLVRLAACGTTTTCTTKAADQDPTGICANSSGRDNL